jgi:hypothetical protein
MNIRKFQDSDRHYLVELWEEVFPDDPPHNEPSAVIDAIRSLKGLGCVKVNLQIRSTNTKVEAFYKSLGFKTEERLSMGTLI